MWIGLNIGRQRANFFGTFAISVYSALGADSLRPLAPCTVVLNYGVFAPDGTVDVRFNYDHRVMDGAVVARALQSLERILTETIVGELAAWK
jgi:pyruvate/2-oxoglutarate dehydrogenase complex dihydrolipoamide acyltransferase (E2) component